MPSTGTAHALASTNFTVAYATESDHGYMGQIIELPLDKLWDKSIFFRVNLGTLSGRCIKTLNHNSAPLVRSEISFLQPSISKKEKG